MDRDSSLTAIEWDVVILGGGPAGAAAGIHCARMGHRTLIIEGSRFPRHRPGESLHPGLEPIFRELGVWDTLMALRPVTFPGITTILNQQKIYRPFGQTESDVWLGIHLRREILDQILLSKAIRNGVRVLQPVQVNSLNFDQSGIANVETSKGTIDARYVIDATGFQRLVARCLNTIEFYSPKYFASYGYVRLTNQDPGPTITISPDGWQWIARIEQDIWQWTHLQTNPTKRLQLEPPEKLRAGRVMGKPRGRSVRWARARKMTGPNYCLVGDAACSLDPASNHGVLRALLSARSAAKVATDTLKHPQIAPQTRIEYETWMNTWFQKDAETLKSWYQENQIVHDH